MIYVTPLSSAVSVSELELRLWLAHIGYLFVSDGSSFTFLFLFKLKPILFCTSIPVPSPSYPPTSLYHLCIPPPSTPQRGWGLPRGIIKVCHIIWGRTEALPHVSTLRTYHYIENGLQKPSSCTINKWWFFCQRPHRLPALASNWHPHSGSLV